RAQRAGHPLDTALTIFARDHVRQRAAGSFLPGVDADAFDELADVEDVAAVGTGGQEAPDLLGGLLGRERVTRFERGDHRGAPGAVGASRPGGAGPAAGATTRGGTAPPPGPAPSRSRSARTARTHCSTAALAAP